ncbi:5'-methylthioadenosine/S-adenosylhomocysteine nucleosidase [Terrihabitans sp. B22-R8]|uniref:5'-methylthioadenosine/S-adenosylhomocysteine nucleosidase n=1 Tax=Terrihabitans sp. B22-R8 TaxID=3425128 RepID=UPI00403CD94C
MIATYEAADGPLRVLFQMAAESEYGPALRSLIDPVITGVGPVEAAVQTALALTRMPADLVVSLGSAGSRSLPQGGIFQVAALSYRDMDASPLGFEKGRTPFLALPALVVLPQQLADVARASLGTGASIVSGDAYDEIDTDMVDMESFAVMRAAALCGAGMIGLRGISDGAEPLSKFTDWSDYLATVDAGLADIVATLPERFATRPRAYWSSVATEAHT